MENRVWFDKYIIHAHNLLETAILHLILDQTLYKINIIYKTRIIFSIFSQGIAGESHNCSVLSFFECAHWKSQIWGDDSPPPYP